MAVELKEFGELNTALKAPLLLKIDRDKLFKILPNFENQGGALVGADGEGGGEVGDSPLLSLSSCLFEVVLETDLAATAPLFSPLMPFYDT